MACQRDGGKREKERDLLANVFHVTGRQISFLSHLFFSLEDCFPAYPTSSIAQSKN